MKRERRSAKSTIEGYANELLARLPDNPTEAKLIALETIALRMGWNDFYNKLRYRKNKPNHIGWIKQRS